MSTSAKRAHRKEPMMAVSQWHCGVCGRGGEVRHRERASVVTVVAFVASAHAAAQADPKTGKYVPCRVSSNYLLGGPKMGCPADRLAIALLSTTEEVQW